MDFPLCYSFYAKSAPRRSEKRESGLSAGFSECCLFATASIGKAGQPDQKGRSSASSIGSIAGVAGGVYAGAAWEDAG